MLVSVIIRTYNEERYLPELLAAIARQQRDGFQVETVIVDSGSTDQTLEIANCHEARVTHIKKDDFSFGRSLNLGCEFARGEVLVFVSGHCIPVGDEWLANLIEPLQDGKADYVYGRQVGGERSQFSEKQVFNKYYPEQDKLPQDGFFCNNANAAILRTTWERYRFDEELTGLEDMHLAKSLVADGGKVGYVSAAAVYHIHHEDWRRIRIRYEREAIALQKIMPEIHMSLPDFLQCVIHSIWLDAKEALKGRRFFSEIGSIARYRWSQYWGGYTGNHDHRRLSRVAKRRYFYPAENVTQKELSSADENRRIIANEGK